MRIGCLQFAPQVGDVDNNLNRADAVLSKANPQDLDILVLPECAFSGYNFKSLTDISPFLEHRGSGISSLWARTTALKHNCAVAVGYPEQVDLSDTWPASPEYYNSLNVVSSDGETIANYRKTHLYYTDERWALEGSGFFKGDLPNLGPTAMGICMDINPYRFEAPWENFEFACHVLDAQANLVIISMAWLTREDARSFSRTPKEPDMETMTYWITRLEPLIRKDDDNEIIVIFCNRTGVEDDAVYAGTSAVIGIHHGEVNVYGLLGRGDKELLVVDTNNPAFAKLVYRPTADTTTENAVSRRAEEGGHTTIKGQESHATGLDGNHSPRVVPGEKCQPGMYSPPRALPPKDTDKECPRVSIPSAKPSELGVAGEYRTRTTPSLPPANIRSQLNMPSGTPASKPRPKFSGSDIKVEEEQYYAPLLEGLAPVSPRYLWVSSEKASGPHSHAEAGMDWRHSAASAHSGTNAQLAQPLSENTPATATAPSNARRLTNRTSRSEMKNSKQLPIADYPRQDASTLRESAISHKSQTSVRSRTRESPMSEVEHSDALSRQTVNDWFGLDQPVSVKRLNSRNATQSEEIETPETLYNRRIENMSKSPVPIMGASVKQPNLQRPRSTIPASENATESTDQRPPRASQHRHNQASSSQTERSSQSKTTRREDPCLPGIPCVSEAKKPSERRGRTRPLDFLANERPHSTYSTRPEPPTSRDNSRERPVLTGYRPSDIVGVEGIVSPDCPVHSGIGTPVNSSRAPSNQDRASPGYMVNALNQRRQPPPASRASSRTQISQIQTHSNARASSTNGRNPITPVSPAGKAAVPDTTSNSAIAQYLKTVANSPVAPNAPVESLITLAESPTAAMPYREPLTPKAMILLPPDKSVLESRQVRPLKCPDEEVVALSVDIPRSAVRGGN